MRKPKFLEAVLVFGVLSLLISSAGSAAGSSPLPSINVRAAGVAAASWTNITANSTGTPNGSIVFDIHDDQTLSSTMTYVHGQWVPNQGPGGNAIAYDPAILSGGVLVVNPNSSVWFFEGGRWTWLNTTGDGPAGVSQLLVVYDTADGYLLAVDGGNPQNIPYCDWISGIWYGDTCRGTFNVWSLSSNFSWAKLPSLPTQVYDSDPNGWDVHDYFSPALAYDTHSGYVVAINSGGETFSFAAGTWTNLGQNIWVNFTADNPGMVSGEAFAYDPQLNGSVLFGGACDVQVDRDGYGGSCPSFGGALAGYNATWVFSSGNWTNVSSSTEPSPRSGVAMTYDDADGYLLAVGGVYQGENATAWRDGTRAPDISHQAWAFSTLAVHPPSPVNHVAISVNPNPTDSRTPVSLSVAFSGGQAPFTYLWSNGSTQWGTTSNYTTRSFDEPGTYAVSVIVTDGQGTHQSSTLDLMVNPLPTTSFSFPAAQTAGVPETFDVVGSNGTGAYRYSLSFGDGAIATSMNGSHEYASDGAYLVTLTTTDSIGQAAFARQSVTVATPIVATLTSSSATPALGQSVWFKVTTAGGLGVFEYAWTGLPGGCSSQDGPIIGCLPTQAGAYAVTALVTDAYHGEAQPTANVSVIFDFALRLSATTITVGQNLTVGVESTASGLTFSYTNLPPGCVSENSPTLTCSPTAAGNYTVEVTVTDVVGNSAYHTFSLEVLAASGAPPVTLPPPSNGTTTSPSASPPLLPPDGILLLCLGALVGGAVVGAVAWGYLVRRPQNRVSNGPVRPN